MLALVSRVGNHPEGAHSSPRARLKVCEPSGQSHEPQWPYTGTSMWSDGQSALSHCLLFHSPWRWRHGARYPSAPLWASHHFHCVCVWVLWFLPPGKDRVNRVIYEAHCDARTTVWMQRMLPKVNISLAEESMRWLFPYLRALSPFQIIIWLQLAKMAYIPAMNAQVTNEMHAHHFLILQNADLSKFLQSLPKMNKSLAQKITYVFGSLVKGSVHPNHKNYFFSPLLIKIVLVYFSQFSRSVSKRSVSAPKQWRWKEFFTKHLPTPKLTILQIMLLCFSIVNDFSYMHLFISIK